MRRLTGSVALMPYVKEPEKDTMKWAITPFPMAQALSKDYPEVEEAVRLWNNGKTMLKNGSQRFYDEKIYYADSNVFRYLHTSSLKAMRKLRWLLQTRWCLHNH
jgi:hypothetical protein